MAPLLVAFLLAQPAASSPVTPAAAPLAVANHVLLVMDGAGEADITPGLKHMAVGAAIGAVGVLAFGIGFGIFGAAVAGAIVAVFIFPGLFSLATLGITGATAVFVACSIVGSFFLLAGGLWGGVNGLLVLARLLPGYKPGPGTDYLAP